MALGKVILAIIGIFFLLLIIVGVDVYMTYNAFADMDEADIANLVSDPQFTVGDDNQTVTISVIVDLPKAGFIPKGVSILLTVTFDGDPQKVERELELGDSKTISIEFTLDSTHATTLSNGGSLTVDAEAEVTPTVFGYAIEQGTQTIDLGTQSVSA